MTTHRNVTYLPGVKQRSKAMTTKKVKTFTVYLSVIYKCIFKNKLVSKSKVNSFMNRGPSILLTYKLKYFFFFGLTILTKSFNNLVKNTDGRYIHLRSTIYPKKENQNR